MITSASILATGRAEAGFDDQTRSLTMPLSWKGSWDTVAASDGLGGASPMSSNALPVIGS